MLQTSHYGDVALLTLQRTERRNALNTDLCRLLHQAVDDVIADNARAIVITGEGTVFCAGADLGGVYGDEFLEALYSMLHHLARVPVPIIAAINGPAIGAGTQLAMACDLRVADATARFAVPTAKNGMAVDAWTIRTLMQLAGAGRARRVMLAADTLDRDEALSCGLVDRSGTLQDALDWASEISRLAPLAVAHNKLVLNSSAADDDVIAQNFKDVWASEDVAEAARARTERREPQFKGR